MADLSTRPNRFYPNVPSTTADVDSLHVAVEAIREALLTHERRDNNYQKSFIRFEELVSLGIIDADGQDTLSASTGGLDNVVEDLTPQLGGDLDVQSYNLTTSVTNGNISIQPAGTGNVVLGNFTFDGDQTVSASEDNYVMTYDHATGTVGLEAPASGPTTDHPHTGEVTGTTSLTGDVSIITNRTAVTEVSDSGTDDLLLHDAGDGSFKKTPVNLVTDGGYF